MDIKTKLSIIGTSAVLAAGIFLLTQSDRQSTPVPSAVQGVRSSEEMAHSRDVAQQAQKVQNSFLNQGNTLPPPPVPVDRSGQGDNIQPPAPEKTSAPLVTPSPISTTFPRVTHTPVPVDFDPLDYAPKLKEYRQEMVASGAIGAGDFLHLRTIDDSQAFMAKLMDYLFKKRGTSADEIAKIKTHLEARYARIRKGDFLP